MIDGKKQKDLQEETGGKGGTSEATQEQTDMNQGNVSEESSTIDMDSDLDEAIEPSDGQGHNY